MEKLKRKLENAARKAEIQVTKSLLRWKYEKEGRPAPLDPALEDRSQELAERANEIITKTGRAVWEELKKAVEEGRKKKEEKDP